MKHKGLRVRKGRMSSTVNGKVPPRRLSNAERRPREYLTPDEVELLITTAQKRVGARTPHRDATMILLAYRHGLRASELCSLRWDMLDLSQGRYHVTRRKNGRPSVHLIRGNEIRALRRLQREQVPQSIVSVGRVRSAAAAARKAGTVHAAPMNAAMAKSAADQARGVASGLPAPRQQLGGPLGGMVRQSSEGIRCVERGPVTG